MTIVISTILILSIAFQLSAAFYSLWLIRITGLRYSWLFMSIAFFLMGIRRLLHLYYIFFNINFTTDLIYELIGLCLSVLMFLGVRGIRPVFAECKDSEHKVKDINRKLVDKNEELNKAVYQLIQSEKLSAVGQLTAGIAHEFNNILAVAYSNVQLIQLIEKKLDGESEESLKTIEKILMRGKKIVSYMMTYAKPTPPKKEFVEIETLLDYVLKLQKKQFELENITIEKVYSKTEKVNVDVGQIQQVFLNLLINARHAIMPKGNGIIKIETFFKNGNIHISISDTGVGMNSETKNKIFTPFFTTKGALAKDDLKIKGTGLGLSVSFIIIEKHNGIINVESSEGVGTKFEIVLPRGYSDVEDCNKDISNIQIENDLQDLSCKILFVDDEESFLKTIEKILKINKFDVTVCERGKQAIEIFSKNDFDLVFLDLLMPDMKGIEIFKELRKINNKTPIVFVSGQLEYESGNLTELGAYSVIQKPFDFQQLIDIIKKVMT
ncbi:response regulator [Candidatus Dependentiae bacterium]|nr:response regulator [Candidatus Dependentiae bacterium]